MKTEPEARNSPAKLPYSQPRLLQYGTIAQMTASAGPKGAKDGGPNNTRSSVA